MCKLHATLSLFPRWTGTVIFINISFKFAGFNSKFIWSRFSCKTMRGRDEEGEIKCELPIGSCSQLRSLLSYLDEEIVSLRILSYLKFSLWSNLFSICGI